jgi:hypothetical protein
VVGEPALGGGQAFLRFGQAEEKIDLDATLADLRAAVARFAADGAGPADPSGAPAAPDAPRHDEETRHA